MTQSYATTLRIATKFNRHSLGRAKPWDDWTGGGFDGVPQRNKQGEDHGSATVALRARFQDAILAANVRGFGEAPIAGWVPAPDDGDLPGWGALY